MVVTMDKDFGELVFKSSKSHAGVLGGAYSVISSLWPVEDEATRIFMEALHSNLKSKDLGNAGLIARNTVRAKGFPPSSYGAFILGGTLGNFMLGN